MAGFNPAEVEFRMVVDLAWALLIEIYGTHGLKFEEAMTELRKSLSDPTSVEGQQARAPDDAASMAALQAMMKGSDFGGPRG